MPELTPPLRVGLLAGTLGRGGAEKQLVYMVRALRDVGVSVRVYSLGEGEFHDVSLRREGLEPIRVGRAAHPLRRLATFTGALRQFRPHIIQAGHFYVNLYVALASRLHGSLSLGAIRSDGVQELRDNGRWGGLLMRMPDALLANSCAARRNAAQVGAQPSTIHVVPNVIDISGFERCRHARASVGAPGQAVAVVVARLVRSKRVDRFLEALVRARTTVPGLKGVVVGVGPERAGLEALAGKLGLGSDGLEFRGSCDDIPALLAEADLLALTSDHEGFPNVILEAMAARLPVVATPAGDAPVVVEDGLTGFVVAFDAVDQLAERLVRLAVSPGLRHEMGQAGYERAKARYGCGGLADRLLAVYSAMASQGGHRTLLQKIRWVARLTNPESGSGSRTDSTVGTGEPSM